MAESSNVLRALTALILLATMSEALHSKGLMMTIVNNCPYDIYPAIQPNSGYPVLEKGGFHLPSLSHRSFAGPSTRWAGRIWARTGCRSENGRFHCATGDCNHQVECNGAGGVPPTGLAEFSLHHGPGNSLCTYVVSLVDGFNIPLTITPHEGKGQCPVVGCKNDLVATCPRNLRFRYPSRRGATVACMSGCEAFNTDELCCRNGYAEPGRCHPSEYSKYFKKSCPATMTYPHDTPSLPQSCSDPRELKVIFCH